MIDSRPPRSTPRSTTRSPNIMSLAGELNPHAMRSAKIKVSVCVCVFFFLISDKR